jgi:hypothetical protein
MKGFYVDLVRAARIALLAGPFASEELARKYERPATVLAMELDPWAAFDSYGVVSLDKPDNEPLPPGKLNDRLDIEPGDLMQLEEA